MFGNVFYAFFFRTWRVRLRSTLKRDSVPSINTRSCAFHWQIPHLRFKFCCLSRQQRISQWDFQPWAAAVWDRTEPKSRRNEGRRCATCCSDPALLHIEYTWKGVGNRTVVSHGASDEWKIKCKMWLWESNVTGVAVVRYSKIVHAIYCMCVCIRPGLGLSRPRSGLWCCVVMCRVLRWVIDSDLLGVCHSLEQWTLPLHRVLIFSWFFFLSWTTIFRFHKFSFDHDDVPVLTWVSGCSCDLFLGGGVSHWLIFATSCTELCCCFYCQCFLFSESAILFPFSVCQTQISPSFSLYVFNYDL